MFDLVILCVNQKIKSKRIPDNTNIFLEYDQKYWEIWKFMTLTKGIWYNLYTEKDEYAGTKLCTHSEEKCNLKLDWVDEIHYESITPYKVDKEYIESFTAILNHLIQKSPVKMIYILARYQSYEKEIVLGSLSVDEFLNLMEQGKIHANICYIIVKPLEKRGIM